MHAWKYRQENSISKKHKCLDMKCKQIQTCMLMYYIVYAKVCANVMYTLHRMLTLKLKVLRNKTQWYLWIITGGFLGSKLGRAWLDLIKMICLLQHYQHSRSVIGGLKSLIAFPQIGSRNGCMLTIPLKGNQGKRFFFFYTTGLVFLWIPG